MGRLVKCLLVSVIGWGIASTEFASQDNLAIIEPVTPNKVLDGGAVAQTREVASPDEENPYAVVVGDTLKIEIFDRKDLSGSFRVRPDGQISLPLIGCVNVRGKTLSRLEDELAKSVRDVTDHATTVSIETVERPPVYTVGFINKPNAYPYVENMTVLHALALAGGLYRALADSGLPAGDIEASRESRAIESDSRCIEEVVGSPCTASWPTRWQDEGRAGPEASKLVHERKGRRTDCRGIPPNARARRIIAGATHSQFSCH